MLDADRYYGEKNEARKLDMEITWGLGGKNPRGSGSARSQKKVTCVLLKLNIIG